MRWVFKWINYESNSSWISLKCFQVSNSCLMDLGCPLLLRSSDRRLRRRAATIDLIFSFFQYFDARNEADTTILKKPCNYWDSNWHFLDKTPFGSSYKFQIDSQKWKTIITYSTFLGFWAGQISIAGEFHQNCSERGALSKWKNPLASVM